MSSIKIIFNALSPPGYTVFLMLFCVHGGVSSTSHNPLQLLNTGHNWLAVQLSHLQSRERQTEESLVRQVLSGYLLNFINTNAQFQGLMNWIPKQTTTKTLGNSKKMIHLWIWQHLGLIGEVIHNTLMLSIIHWC